MTHVPERDTLLMTPSRRASKGQSEAEVLTCERLGVESVAMQWPRRGLTWTYYKALITSYFTRPRESSSRTSSRTRTTPGRPLLWCFAITKARRPGVNHSVSLSGTLYAKSLITHSYEVTTILSDKNTSARSYNLEKQKTEKEGWKCHFIDFSRPKA